jgi:hypothetical protein
MPDYSRRQICPFLVLAGVSDGMGEITQTAGLLSYLAAAVNLLTVLAGDPICPAYYAIIVRGCCMDGNSCRCVEDPCGNLVEIHVCRSYIQYTYAETLRAIRCPGDISCSQRNSVP